MKISYCTTCHKRLWQLETTIAHNIKYTLAGEVDIVILFYNDPESFDSFNRKYKQYIEDGRIKVYNHIEDKVFKDGTRWSCGYTKDIVHRLGTGRVLFNLDADNYIDDILHSRLLSLKDKEMIITLQREWRPDGRSGRIGICASNYGDISYGDMGRADDTDFLAQAVRHRFKMYQVSCKYNPVENIKRKESV